MTPRHEVIRANGLPVETFWPGRNALPLLGRFERLALIALIPGLLGDTEAVYGPPALLLA